MTKATEHMQDMQSRLDLFLAALRNEWSEQHPELTLRMGIDTCEVSDGHPFDYVMLGATLKTV